MTKHHYESEIANDDKPSKGRHFLCVFIAFTDIPIFRICFLSDEGRLKDVGCESYISYIIKRRKKVSWSEHWQSVHWKATLKQRRDRMQLYIQPFNKELCERSCSCAYFSWTVTIDWKENSTHHKWAVWQLVVEANNLLINSMRYMYSSIKQFKTHTHRMKLECKIIYWKGVNRKNSEKCMIK